MGIDKIVKIKSPLKFVRICFKRILKLHTFIFILIAPNEIALTITSVT